MSQQPAMTVRDFYLRTTTPTGVTVTRHRVWDAIRFLAARRAEAERENTKARAEGLIPGYIANPSDEDEFKRRGRR